MSNDRINALNFTNELFQWQKKRQLAGMIINFTECKTNIQLKNINSS